MLIISAILTFVVIYSRFTSRDSYQRQIEHFENTTVTMEKIVRFLNDGCTDLNACDKIENNYDALIQVRQAVYKVGTGEMPIDEALAGFGKFTQ